LIARGAFRLLALNEVGSMTFPPSVPLAEMWRKTAEPYDNSMQRAGNIRLMMDDSV